MAVEGIDFAWSQPSPSEAKAVGAHWAAGYFSTDSTKNLTRSLVSNYLAAGLAIVSVWETTTGRATEGRAAGIADAHAADAQRSAVGLPNTAPIHFAVDEDTSWASVAAYFEGVISVLGISRVGAYGGLHVIEGAHSCGIPYLWQTVAWSGGIWASYATIRQPGGMVLSGGSDLDYAEVPDFGQTPKPAASTTPGTTTPAEDTMPQWINGSITPGTAPVVVLVPAGAAWSAFPHRTLHLGMDEPGVAGAHASVRVAVHDGGADWKSVQTAAVTAKDGTVAVDITGAVKVSLQTASAGVSYSIEVW